MGDITPTNGTSLKRKHHFELQKRRCQPWSHAPRHHRLGGISTRRLRFRSCGWSRPLGVVLGATGSLSPPALRRERQHGAAPGRTARRPAGSRDSGASRTPSIEAVPNATRCASRTRNGRAGRRRLRGLHAPPLAPGAERPAVRDSRPPSPEAEALFVPREPVRERTGIQPRVDVRGTPMAAISSAPPQKDQKAGPELHRAKPRARRPAG